MILVLAAGHAGASAAHPAKPRSCGSLGIKSDGMPVGVTVERGSVKCATAKKVLRTYFPSNAPCEGSACRRQHFGWTCLSAKAPDWPELAGCTKGRSRIVAYAPAD